MKIYFATLTALDDEPVDAYTVTIKEGITLLDALAFRYSNHCVVMRARVKCGENIEERYIGPADKADRFFRTLRQWEYL